MPCRKVHFQYMNMPRKYLQIWAKPTGKNWKHIKWFIFIFPDGPGGGVDGGNVKELQELRDRYEGKLTATLYTGILTVSVVATLSALIVLFIFPPEVRFKFQIIVVIHIYYCHVL